MIFNKKMLSKSVLTISIFFAATAFAQQQHGVLVRVAAIRVNPDPGAATLDTAQRGREVVIINRSHDWLQALVNLGEGRQLTGWIEDRGVVFPSTPNGDRILFGAAEDSEDEAARPHGRPGAAQDAMRMYAKLEELLPQSPLAAESLYRAADIRWQIDAADVMSRPSAKEQDPGLRSRIDEEVMRKVMKKYAHTKWADLAAYHLLDNQLCGDWQGQSKCPERETDLYEKYVREHPQSPKAPEALYKAAWRQAALVEIYKTEGELDRSAHAKNKALDFAARIPAQFPQSDWATRALTLTYMLQQNIPTYGSGRE
jgi:hypothetical protein